MPSNGTPDKPAHGAPTVASSSSPSAALHTRTSDSPAGHNGARLHRLGEPSQLHQPKLLDIDPNKPTKELEWTVLALFRLYVAWGARSHFFLAFVLIQFLLSCLRCLCSNPILRETIRQVTPSICCFASRRVQGDSDGGITLAKVSRLCAPRLCASMHAPAALFSLPPFPISSIPCAR